MPPGFVAPGGRAINVGLSLADPHGGSGVRAVSLAPLPIDDIVPGVPMVSPRERRDQSVPPPDLTEAGAVAWGSTPAVIIDTRTFPVQIQPKPFLGAAPGRRIRDIVPAHNNPGNPLAGEPNDLVAGLTMAAERVTPLRLFPSIDSTGWVPPDPCLAVGPNHVLVTVNQSLAWYTKTGTPQFEAFLGSPGNPGFFEPLGGGNFCFDPKCFYDHTSQRFVVLTLETYNNNEAWITIAVSDDSDPNGVWYKYRTDAVILAGAVTCWWDFPGFSYDQNAIYVTGNLFGLSASGFYGVGVRVFNKTPLLTGSAATFATMREASIGTLMPALHFGTNQAGFAVTVQSSTSVRVYAVRNPITAPTLTFTTVTVPAYANPITPPTLNGAAVSTAGITSPMWRNGRLVMVQNASVGGRNKARWHEFNTGDWPASGNVTRVQSGDIDGGGTLHTIFPAIGINSSNDIAVTVGLTGTTSRVSVANTGRRVTDPVGVMATPTVVRTGDSDIGGRWGDYYAIAVDPTDDTTFWGVGEYSTAGGGWDNWVSSFRISDSPVVHAVADSAGTFQTFAAPQPPNASIDVMANDFHSSGLTFSIATFDAMTTRGGTVTRVVGGGPGGRDVLRYTPPVAAEGMDTFNYTIVDPSGASSTTAVTATLFNPVNYRTPENPSEVRAGVQAAYYDLVAPTTLPDFSTLTPFGYALLPQINFPSTNGLIAGSGRADNVGAVIEGYIDAPGTDLYTFYLNSDDGSKMYLGDTLIVDNNGAHGMVERASTAIGLNAGRHRVKIEYFEGGGGAGLIASRSSTTITKSVIPVSAWSSVRPCPSNLVAAANPMLRTVTLSWQAPVGVNAPTVMLTRNGFPIATGLSATTSSFIDTPPLPTDKRHVTLRYALVPEGAGAPSCTLTAEAALSSGDVRLSESFDSFADAAGLTAAGWVISNTATATENAGWIVSGSGATAGGTRANPATFNGRPSVGRFIISDSEAATGTNPTGTGASHDIVTPPIDCSGMSNAFVHIDVSAQLNNNGSAVFEIEAMSDQDPTWRLVIRRVSPSRTSPAPAATTGNANGAYGRISATLGVFAAGRTGVKVRLRHFEPTNDWWVAVDNILIDDVAISTQGSETILPTVNFSTGIPPTWSISGPQSGANTWTTTDPCRRSVAANGGIFPRQGGNGSARLGTLFAIVDSNCASALAHDDYLKTPAMDCSAFGRVYLSLKSETVTANGATQEILVSTDGGTTFDPLPVFSYSTGALAQRGEDPFFDIKVLDVPAAAGRNNVVFAFRYANSGGGWWWGIDDVKVTGDRLAVCAADFNNDGSLNPDDLADYIACFFAIPPCPAADFSGDGAADPDDLADFIGAFFAGCP